MRASSDLPITISADKALMETLGLSATLLEKLEAWANFSTLKANWYGDEHKVVAIKITLINQAFFNQHFLATERENWQITPEKQQAISASTNQLKQSVFIVVDKVNQQQLNHDAKWVESKLQEELQQELWQLLNHIGKQLSFDAIDKL